MSEEDTQASTEDATQAGAETDTQADTKDDATQGATFSQSELDSRITRALQAQSEKAKSDAERKRLQDEQVALVQDGKYEELYNGMQAKMDAMEASIASKDFRVEANSVLLGLGMSHFQEVLIPGTGTIDELIQKAELLRKANAESVATGVKDALGTGKPRVPDNTHRSAGLTVEEASKDPEKFIEWKKQSGLS